MISPELIAIVVGVLTILMAILGIGIMAIQRSDNGDARNEERSERRAERIERSLGGVDAKIDSVKTEMDAKIDSVKTDVDVKIDSVKTEMDAKIDSVKTDVDAKIDSVKTEVDAKIDSVKTEVDAKIDSVKTEMDAKIDEVRTDLKTEIAEGNARSEAQGALIIAELRDFRESVEGRLNGVEREQARQEGILSVLVQRDRTARGADGDDSEE